MQWKTGTPNTRCRCLVKTSTNEILRLDYTTDWEYPESHIVYNAEDNGQIIGWESISVVDNELTDHTKYWAYNFNTAFIESAIPALKLWIDTGCSHPAGMDPDVWDNIKKTILSAFVEYAKLDSNEHDELSLEERDIKWKESKRLLKIAFHLIGEYFEDMWD